MIKIIRPAKVGPRLWAHKCPLCGELHASADDPGALPEFSLCNCDGGRGAPFRFVRLPDGSEGIECTEFPRFTARVTRDGFGRFTGADGLPGSEDLCGLSALEVARAMRIACDYIYATSSREFLEGKPCREFLDEK